MANQLANCVGNN